MRRKLAILTLLAAFGSSAHGQAMRALVGKPAPEIKAIAWLNSGKAAPTLKALKGKVIVLDFFAWW